MMTEKIGKCPFCGSENVGFQEVCVVCVDCGAEGPYFGSEEEAVLLWNAAANALEQKDAEIARLVEACDDLEGEYLRMKEQRDEALATRDAAVSKLSEMRTMWIGDVKMLQDRNGILLNQRDEAREWARRYYNAANAWMKNWTELINALPARNEPQSVRIENTNRD